MLHIDIEKLTKTFHNQWALDKSKAELKQIPIEFPAYGDVSKILAIEWPPPQLCNHENFKITKHFDKLGRTIFIPQCMFCGRRCKQQVSKQCATGNEPLFNVEAEKKSHELSNDLSCKRSHYLAERGIRHRDAQEKAQKTKRRETYEAYLKTQEWSDKRQRVLVRDNFLCQGCLINRATQVHHTTYSHLGKELFFQLISLCDDCHKNIHDI